jgi:hypothetical protein
MYICASGRTTMVTFARLARPRLVTSSLAFAATWALTSSEKLFPAILSVLRGRRRKSHSPERFGFCPQLQLCCLQKRGGLFFNGPNIERGVRSHNSRMEGCSNSSGCRCPCRRHPSRRRKFTQRPSHGGTRLSSPIRKHWRHFVPLAVETSQCTTVASTTMVITCRWAQRPL